MAASRRSDRSERRSRIPQATDKDAIARGVIGILLRCLLRRMEQAFSQHRPRNS